MTEDPHCPWCPTQPDTPEHLLHCPRHYSHRMALFHSLSSLHLRKPTITDFLGDSPVESHVRGKLLLVCQARIWRVSRPWLGLQSPQTHQDLPPEDRSTQQDLIHLLICNLHFLGTRGCGTTACRAPSNSQEEGDHIQFPH